MESLGDLVFLSGNSTASAADTSAVASSSADSRVSFSSHGWPGEERSGDLAHSGLNVLAGHMERGLELGLPDLLLDLQLEVAETLMTSWPT